MLAGVMTIANEIAANAPLAVHGCKRAITYARDHTTQEGLEWIGMWNASMLQNDEIIEAMAARQDSDRLNLSICLACEKDFPKLVASVRSTFKVASEKVQITIFNTPILTPILQFLSIAF